MKFKQIVYCTLGWASIVGAIIGVIVPGIPWFPFLLLALICFKQGSLRVHAIIISRRWVVGRAYHAWQEEKRIPWEMKLLELAIMIPSVAISLYFLESPALKIFIVLVTSISTIVLFLQKS